MPPIVALFREKKKKIAAFSHQFTPSLELLCRSMGHLKQGCIKWDQVITLTVIVAEL